MSYLRFIPAGLCFAAVVVWGGTSSANPIGGEVKAGSASFEGGPSSLTIRQSSDRGIIHWQDFSIGKGETTKFLQPNSNSAILNRVTGGKRSDLLGALQANGNVFLINPSGILVGQGAVIDTNSFIASTLDISDEQFMAGGDLKFMGDSTASVINLGKITARGGDVFLIANTVENAGIIDAPNGTAGLAAGQEVLLKSAGDERLFVAPSSKSSSVHNSGTISGATAELKASGNLYALAINNTGTVRATGTVNKGGRVIFTAGGGEVRNTGTVAARNANGSGGFVKLDSGRGGKTVNSGTIDASGKAKGAKGGRVEVLGEQVELTTGSLVDVSGDAGGGVALIGGDKYGGNTAVPNSRTTTVAAGATIKADAISNGPGGTAVVWADETNTFAGTITARGGAGGGDGGFAEVSGSNLRFTGVVDLSATGGKFGTLLLDPKNVTVTTSAAPAQPGDVNDFATNPGADSRIHPDTLRDLLANVTIKANNDFRLESALDLRTTTGGTATAGKSFTVEAGRSIQIEAALTTANGDVNLTANTPSARGVVVAHRDSGAAALVFQAGGSVTTNGGNVNLTIETGQGLNDSASGDISFAFSTIDAGAGNVSLLNKGPGNAGVAGGIYGYNAGKVIAHELTMAADGNIWFFNNQNDVNFLYVTNGGAVDYTDADDLVVGKATNVGGNTVYTGSLQVGRGDVKITTLTGDLTVNAPAYHETSNNSPSGIFSLEAGGKLVVNEGVNKLLTQVGVDVTYKGGTDVELKAAEIGARNLTVQATRDILLNFLQVVGKYGIVTQDISPNGVVMLTAGRDILGSAASTISARDLQLTATTGRIDLDGIANVNLLSATAAGAVAVDGTFANAIGELRNISSGGNITINDSTLGLQINGLVRSTGVNAVIAIKAAGTGTVQFVTGANNRIETLPSGTIIFESGGQILDSVGAGATPSFIGGSLAITGRAIGGGLTNPLNTQVSRLEASAKASGGFGGFAFITNNEAVAGTLAIGGVSSSLGGVTGDGKNSSNVSVHLTNNGSVVLDPAVGTDWIGAVNPNSPLGDVTVIANGAASNIEVGSGFFGVGIISDSKLSLTAGNNILVGEGANASVRGGTDVELTAGGSVLVKNGASIINLGSGLLKVTATNSVQSLANATNNTAFRSGGGITLIAQNGQIALGANDLTNPVLRANENGGTNNVVLQANKMTIDGKVAASGGNVELQQNSSSVSVVVGTKTVNDLSFTDAELDRISGARLHIGSFMAQPTTTVTVTAPITRPTSGLTYGALQLMGPGLIDVQSSLDMDLGNLSLASLSGNVQGTGNITAHDLSVFTSTGSIDLDGNVVVLNLELNAPGGNIFVEGSGNNIRELTFARYLQEFRLKDFAGGLLTTGFVDGSADSYGFIEVHGGSLTLGTGTEVIFGANNPFGYVRNFKLYSDTAFINQAGAGAIVTEYGARYLIYVPDNGPAQLQLGGLTPNFALAGVSYPTEPANPGNGVLIAAANPALPLSTSLGTPSGGTAGMPTSGTASSSKPKTQSSSGQGEFSSISKALAGLSEIGEKFSEATAAMNSMMASLEAAVKRNAEKAKQDAAAANKTDAAEDKERRLAIWPPEGAYPLKKEQVRSMLEQEWAERGDVGIDKYLYWELSNMKTGRAKLDAIYDLRDNGNETQKTTAALIIYQEHYMPFTTKAAANQFVSDYGLNSGALTVEYGGLYFAYLPENMRNLPNRQPAPPPAPVIAPKPNQTVISVTTVSPAVNPAWPPPK